MLFAVGFLPWAFVTRISYLWYNGVGCVVAWDC